MGQVIDLDSRREPAAEKKVRERVETNNVREVMEQKAQIKRFGASRIVNEDYLKELPRSVREVRRFLATLSEREQLKAERLVEDITIDARVHDHSFTCTAVYLRSNKDPEIPPIYQKIRTAVYVNLGIMLPELPTKK